MLRAQEVDELARAQSLTPRVVLEQTVVPQKDGGSMTFQKIAPPPMPVPVVKAPVVLTEAEKARIVEVEAKQPAMLSISASVHEGGFTVLRWSCMGNGWMEGLSNVDFRLLTGLGQIETQDHYYSLVMSAGADPSDLTPEQALQKQALPADGSSAFVLTNGKTVFTTDEEQAVMAMAVLHDYFEANREMLGQRHAQREAEREARELAQRNASPPPPRHSVIQFWPLSADQKATLRAVHNAELVTPEPPVETSPTGGTN